MAESLTTDTVRALVRRVERTWPSAAVTGPRSGRWPSASTEPTSVPDDGRLRMLDSRSQRRQRARNVVQSTLLLGCLLAVAAGMAWFLLGVIGLLWTLALGGLVLLLRPRIPPRLVLAMYRAQPLPYDVVPDLHWMVDELAARAGLHYPPALYYVPSPVPNCFCAGHGREAALALTDGILRRLTRREIAGVLAHELGHLRAGDTTVMSLTDMISRLAQVLAFLGMAGALTALPLAFDGRPQLLLLCAVLVFLPFVVTLLQMALSRSREFDADLAAARLTGDPEGLACALQTLDETTGRIWERILLRRGALPDPLLLRTHPSTEERTRRLRELEPRDTHRLMVVGRATPPAGYPHVVDPPRLGWPGVRW